MTSIRQKIEESGIQASDRTDDARCIAENVASIEACPERVLSGHDRAFALHWAKRGYDVYAYKGHGEHGRWNLWLADRRIELGPATE